MNKKILAALFSVSIAMTAAQAPAHAGKFINLVKKITKVQSANGGNGGSFNVVIGNGNSVGNGGNGGRNR